jgi:hypothetical protein
MGSRLKTFRPYGEQRGYSQAVAAPAKEPEGGARSVLAPPSAAPDPDTKPPPAGSRAAG